MTRKLLSTEGPEGIEMQDPSKIDRREFFSSLGNIVAFGVATPILGPELINYFDENQKQSERRKRINESSFEKGKDLYAKTFFSGPITILEPDNEWQQPPSNFNLAMLLDYKGTVDFTSDNYPEANSFYVHEGVTDGKLWRDSKFFGEPKEPTYHIEEYTDFPNYVELGPKESRMVELPSEPSYPSRLYVVMATRVLGQVDDVRVRMGEKLAEIQNTGLSEVTIHMLPEQPDSI